MFYKPGKCARQSFFQLNLSIWSKLDVCTNNLPQYFSNKILFFCFNEQMSVVREVNRKTNVRKLSNYVVSHLEKGRVRDDKAHTIVNQLMKIQESQLIH